MNKLPFHNLRSKKSAIPLSSDMKSYIKTITSSYITVWT